MNPSGPHAAPRGSETFATSIGDPPARSTRHIRPRAKKPSDCPSGDQNGPVAPSVPLIGTVAKLSSDLTRIVVAPAAFPTNAMLRPSGEIAGACSTTVPAGALIETASRVEGAVEGRDSIHAPAASAASTASVATTADGWTRRGSAAAATADPLRPSVATASSAYARSRADWNRCRASFSRQRRITALMAGGTLAALLDRSGGSWLRIAFIVSADVAPWNARRPREHLVGDRTERKDVGALIDVQPTDLFRRHVADGAEQQAGGGPRCCDSRDTGACIVQSARRQLRQPEVQNLHRAIVGHEDVFRLQIAMEDAAIVGSREPVQDTVADLHDLARRKWSSVDARAEGATGQQLGDNIGRRTVAADIVEGDDVWMIEGRGGARLLLEAGNAILIGRDARGQDLNRDLAVQPAIVRAIDLAHSAGAEQRGDPVWAEPGARGEGQAERNVTPEPCSREQASRARPPMLKLLVAARGRGTAIVITSRRCYRRHL